MSNRKFKASWDMGNGWKQTKAEWSDIDQAEDMRISLDEFKELKCPASGSRVTIDLNHIKEGLEFTLSVGMKEYRPNTKNYGGKYEYRKPTLFSSNVQGSLGIPLPGQEVTHANNWCEKKTWASAQKLILNDIIPIYENADDTTMSMWTVVPRQIREAVS